MTGVSTVHVAKTVGKARRRNAWNRANVSLSPWVTVGMLTASCSASTGDCTSGRLRRGGCFGRGGWCRYSSTTHTAAAMRSVTTGTSMSVASFRFCHTTGASPTRSFHGRKPGTNVPVAKNEFTQSTERPHGKSDERGMGQSAQWLTIQCLSVVKGWYRTGMSTKVYALQTARGRENARQVYFPW